MDDFPTGLSEIRIAFGVTQPPSLGQMLPAVAFQRDAVKRKREVYGIASYFMLEQVEEIQVEEDRFRHRFDVRSIAGLALLAAITRIKTVSHPQKGRAPVTAAADILSDQAIAFYHFLLAAIGTDDPASPGGIQACFRTVDSLLLRGDPLEGAVAARTFLSDPCRRCRRPAAFNRAIEVIGALAHRYLKGPAAARAFLLHPVPLTQLRAEPTPDRGMVGILLATPLTDILRTGRPIASIRAVFPPRLARLDAEGNSAAFAKQAYQGVMTCLRSFQPSHTLLFDVEAAFSFFTPAVEKARTELPELLQAAFQRAGRR